MVNKKIKFKDIIINEDGPVFMIAEIGINHNGNLEIAKKLIDAASACNWHCVKFQKRDPDISVPEAQKGQMRDTPWGKITYLNYRKKVEFGKNEYDYIDRFCKDKPIYWTASVWDVPSLRFILKYDIPFIKVPSAKLTNKELLIEAGKSGKPVILSTGMSTLEEIDEAVYLLNKHSKDGYVLMHANSTYPTPAQDINLKVILLLRGRYKCIVGYSGHEFDLEPTVVAVALGAKVIERHVTLDHKMWGSDHFASLEVHAMDLLSKRIKDIDIIIGDGRKRLTNGELEARKRLRGN